MSFTRSTLIDFQTVLAPLVKTSNVQFYKKPNAGSRLGSAINAPFTRSGAGRKVIDASGNLVDAAANVPAWTFPIGGSSAGCPYLSFLPSVENLVTYSEQFDNAAWTKTSGTITANSTTSPDGTANADTFTLTSTSGRLERNVTLTDNTDYTLSTFVKNIDASNDLIGMLAFAKDGTACSATFRINESGSIFEENNSTANIVSMGNSWYFCSITFNSASGATSPSIRAVGNVTGSGGFTNGESVYIFGAQLKEGSYISPLDYVKTEASAVTRSVDQITDITDLQTAGYLSSASEGAIMFQVGFDSVEASGTSNAFTFEDGSNNDVFGLRTSTTGVQIYDYVNAAVADTITDQGGLHRVVISFSTTQIDIAVDGFDEYSASGDFSIQDLEDMLADVGLNVKMLNFNPTTQTSDERQAASSWPSFDLMVSDLGYS